MGMLQRRRNKRIKRDKMEKLLQGIPQEVVIEGLYIGDAPPIQKKTGDMYYNTKTGRTFVYHNKIWLPTSIK